jgi:hypothetical protein
VFNYSDTIRLIQAWVAEQRWLKAHHLRWLMFVAGIAVLIVLRIFHLI